MFNSTRTLFPAYSNLDDVRVALPSPPSRAAVARDVGDLWKIHTSEPHITPLEDPGVAAPLPDNGFDPRRDLPETSPENILANRGGGPLDDKTFMRLSEELQSLYAKCAAENKHLASETAGEIKSHMDRTHPGALFVYNGTNKDLLIKALSLIEALSELSESFVASATFAEEAKASLITFFKVSPAVREAMFLPDPMIRQRLFGNTTTFNNVVEALKAFGLDEDGEGRGAAVAADDEFSDFREALALASAELKLHANLSICDGVASRALQHCVSQVTPSVRSSELRAQFRDCVSFVQGLAAKNALKCVADITRVVQGVKADMQRIGVDPATFRKLQLKEQRILADAQRAKSVGGARSSADAHITPRSFNELAETSRMLAGVQAQLEGFLAKTSTLPAEHKLALYCELYCVMCLQDCCGALASGAGSITPCAERLYAAICDEVLTSETPDTKILANDVELAEKSLQSAQVSQTIHLLQKAKSENSISDKKLETLTKLIG
jgi:hypothetical protein